MKKFELWLGCFGNGLTVCNKAVEERGDYKKIAHIAECGKINWYVNAYTIPRDALLKIEHEADVYRTNWEKRLDDMPKMEAYEKLLKLTPLKTMLEANKINDINARIEFLKTEYYKIAW